MDHVEENARRRRSWLLVRADSEARQAEAGETQALRLFAASTILAEHDGQPNHLDGDEDDVFEGEEVERRMDEEAADDDDVETEEEGGQVLCEKDEQKSPSLGAATLRAPR